MTIPIPNKDSMACLQTSKTKFMITDILSSASAEKDNNNQNVNNTNNSGSEIHNNNNNNISHLQHQTHPHLPPHHLMVGRDGFNHNHHHHHHLANLQNARMSSPEYDDLQDGGSDCDSDDMNDDNSVSSNGEFRCYLQRCCIRACNISRTKFLLIIVQESDSMLPTVLKKKQNRQA